MRCPDSTGLPVVAERLEGPYGGCLPGIQFDQGQRQARLTQIAGHPELKEGKAAPGDRQAFKAALIRPAVARVRTPGDFSRHCQFCPRSEEHTSEPQSPM